MNSMCNLFRQKRSLHVCCDHADLLTQYKLEAHVECEAESVDKTLVEGLR